MSPKRKPGRPPGRKNIEYIPIEQPPAICPRCKSTRLANLPHRSPIVRRYHGPQYDRVIIRAKRCECGQHVMVRTYEKQSEAAQK